MEGQDAYEEAGAIAQGAGDGKALACRRVADRPFEANVLGFPGAAAVFRITASE